MKRAVVCLLLFVVAVPLALADEPTLPNPLTGARTIYVDADLATKRDIRAVLAEALPTLREVAKPEDADVIVQFHVHFNATGPQTPHPGQVLERNRYGQLVTSGGRPFVGRPLSSPRPRLVMDGMAGVVSRRDNPDVVLLVHHGVQSPFFATQFATNLVAAFGEANATR